MVSHIHPKVSLIGAGPGDPDLLTIKGMKALQEASVVLYDALVDESMLDLAPKNALKVYVGKRAGQHSFKQEEINQLIVDYAFSHGHVVRLKGGDPFIFGRGHEEMIWAQKSGVEVSIVPGISSCYSLAELQGIPLTRRRVSESFWVLTATTREGKLSDDIALAAQSSATVVILMGMRKLGKIVNEFQTVGKNDTPVMIIQNGSRPDEKVVTATVDTIETVVEEEKIGAPAIIVVGKVISLEKLQKKVYQYQMSEN
ncbi:uroporphyrinogen-III C-methyltransferase [Sediminitomix flava]|uniref:uroporphyrinogen-III C-methyltransferase n=1 Tax=Sediminitomix flava TaxID=379075 RepID=A0A315ZBJ3_SEDFL|nr:uroporphyrinogen-III C-methyltransferase [Sediminitomix flava]PWJ42730.1 uroporphyrinogen-III C-methyltransferase [Sediminitomix flava]